MDADKVIQWAEEGSSDEEGKGIFAYAGQQHLDTAELTTLSSGVALQPSSSTTGANLDASGKMCRSTLYIWNILIEYYSYRQIEVLLAVVQQIYSYSWAYGIS